MSTFAGYHRVSRVGDRDENLRSPEHAEETIRRYADGRKIKVKMLPTEFDVSGGTTERPILEEAIQGIESGRYVGIICSQLDRLSRMELSDALATIRRIEQAGGEVIAVAENFDAGTPEGRLGRNMWLSIADMQLSRYKIQLARSKQNAVRDGIWPFPAVPFGYTCTRRKDHGDGRLHPDPRTRRKLLAGFAARAGGGSVRVAAKAMGVAPSTASKLLKNRVYLGELRLSWKGENGQGGEWVNPVAHEAIVPLEVFEAAQFDHPRPARSGRGPALLAGVARCAGCRSVLSLDARQGGKRTYRCKPHKLNGSCPAPAMIGAVKFEQYVEALALEHIGSLRFSAAERSSAVDKAEEELRAAVAELEAYQGAVSAAGLGVEETAKHLRQRAETIEESRAALGVAKRAAGPMPEPGTLLDLYPSMTVEERRHVLRGALAIVWVRKGRGNIGDRVRAIEAGHEPVDLPTPARVRHGKPIDISPLAWGRDLPGEIRMATA